MKKAEIKVGQVYAVAEGYEWEQDRAAACEVMEVGVDRKVDRGFTTGRSANRDGVRVRVLEGSIRGHSQERGNPVKVVRSADVRELWSTYQPARDARAQAAQDAAAQAVAAAEDVTRRITAVLPADALEEGLVPSQNYKGVWSTQVRLTFTTLADLLEQAAEHARSTR